jgi:hypothetical protein
MCTMNRLMRVLLAPPEPFAGFNVLDMFSEVGYRPAMSDASSLRPATADEIAETLSFALLYQGRKRVHNADNMLARITAERLVQHLEALGFVLMKRPPCAAPTTGGMPPPGRGSGRGA